VQLRASYRTLELLLERSPMLAIFPAIRLGYAIGRTSVAGLGG
jgi:hypothetical protein